MCRRKRGRYLSASAGKSESVNACTAARRQCCGCEGRECSFSLLIQYSAQLASAGTAELVGSHCVEERVRDNVKDLNMARVDSDTSQQSRYLFKAVTHELECVESGSRRVCGGDANELWPELLGCLDRRCGDVMQQLRKKA